MNSLIKEQTTKCHLEEKTNTWWKEGESSLQEWGRTFQKNKFTLREQYSEFIKSSGEKNYTWNIKVEESSNN